MFYTRFCMVIAIFDRGQVRDHERIFESKRVLVILLLSICLRAIYNFSERMAAAQFSEYDTRDRKIEA
jgi:hypothetical protein